MIITTEMQQAIELISNTKENIYITGKAGTGKTTLLKHIVGTIDKKFIITAPTGVAAVNAGGITLHSFLTIPFGALDSHSASNSKFNPRRKKLANAIDVLIIDEVSMVRADLMDFVDIKLRMYRQCAEPFGGVQVIMFGDLHQLPPVVTKNEEEIINQMYPNPYFFCANVFKEKGFKVIELSHIFRQSDDTFIRILNNIRDYKVTSEDLDCLEEIRNKAVSENFDNKNIHLCALRRDADRINSTLLGTPTFTYKAIIDDGFNNSSMPCDELLRLRVGARVMTLINNPEEKYYNGSLGYVQSLNPESVIVALDSGHITEIKSHKWEQVEYRTKEKKVDGEVVKTIVKHTKGSCEQIPLSLAWAITIHKSQGLTFDSVVIHSSSIFCSGQLYVALSRCRTLQGITTDRYISQRMIYPDYQLSAFERAYKAQGNNFDRIAYRNMLYENRARRDY